MRAMGNIAGNCNKCLKHRAFCGQTIKVWGVDDLIAVAPQKLRSQLIDLDKKDVRLHRLALRNIPECILSAAYRTAR